MLINGSMNLFYQGGSILFAIDPSAPDLCAVLKTRYVIIALGFRYKLSKRLGTYVLGRLATCSATSRRLIAKGTKSRNSQVSQ